MKKIGLAAIFLVLMVASNALSAAIKLAPEISVQEKPEALTVGLAIENRGDTAAYQIVTELEIGGQTIGVGPIDKIEPNGTYGKRVQFGHQKMRLPGPGSYPIFIRLWYEDLSHYRFCANDLYILHYRSEPMNGRVRLKADVKNLGGNYFEMDARLEPAGMSGELLRNATIQAVMPESFSCEPIQYNFSLTKNERKNYNFRIKNETGLKGSQYKIFALAQYQCKGKHYTQTAPAFLNIKDAPAPPNDARALTLALTFMVILFIVAVVFILEVFGCLGGHLGP